MGFLKDPLSVVPVGLRPGVVGILQSGRLRKNSRTLLRPGSHLETPRAKGLQRLRRARSQNIAQARSRERPLTRPQNKPQVKLELSEKERAYRERIAPR